MLVGEYMDTGVFSQPSTPPNIDDGLGTGYVRRCMGLWYNNGLHHLWCNRVACYHICNLCSCKLCGSTAINRYHLEVCRWINKDYIFLVNKVVINNIVRVLERL